MVEPKNRRLKGIENRLAILEFLCIHTYSDIETIRNHLGVKSKPMISRILSKLVFDGYLKKAEIKNSFGRVVLFGVTRKAIDEEIDRRIFLPHKVNLRTLEHTLYCQRASSYFLKSEQFQKQHIELKNVETGDIKKYGLKHRPDLLMKPEFHPFVCVEVELSLKSKQRYKSILSEYCSLLKREKITQVIYVFYNERKANIFKENILGKYLTQSGQLNMLKKITVKVLE